MEYDYHTTWFGGLSKTTQAILLVIPFLGVLAELIMRVGISIKKRSLGWFIFGIIYTFLSCAYIVCIIDAISIYANGKPIFCD